MIAPPTLDLVGDLAIQQGASYALRVMWLREKKLLFPFYTGQTGEYYMARLRVYDKEDYPFIRSNALAFVDGGAGSDTITDADSSFLEHAFVGSIDVIVQGSVSNEGKRSIVSVAEGALTLATATLVTETAGRLVEIYKVPLLKMSSENLWLISKWTDQGLLNIGPEERIGIDLNGRETAELDFRYGYYDLMIVPCETGTVGPVAVTGLVTDVDNGAGFGTITEGAGSPFGNFLAGDGMQILTSTNGSDGRYVVLSAAASNLTLTDVLEGTDCAADTTMVIKRLIPNWGAAFKLLQGRVELKRGIVR